MATTNYTDKSAEGVLFNNAELMTPLDFNEMQRLGERRMLDALLRGMYLDGYDPGTHPQARPIGGAFSIRESAVIGMSVRVYPGTLLFRGAADPGTPDPGWMMHRMESLLTVAVDAASGVNPRIDLLSYKVEYDIVDTASADAEARVTKTVGGTYTSQTLDKRRRTKLTITYTPGTAAASPVAPATPAGHVAFAHIEVPTSDTTIATEQIIDYRTPAGSMAVHRMAFEGHFNGGSVSSPGNPLSYWDSSPSYASESVASKITPSEQRGMIDTADASGTHLAHYRLKSLRIKCNWNGIFYLMTQEQQVVLDTTDIDPFITPNVQGNYSITLPYPIWSMGGDDAGAAIHRNPWTAIDNPLAGDAHGCEALMVYGVPGATDDVYWGIYAEWYGL